MLGRAWVESDVGIADVYNWIDLWSVPDRVLVRNHGYGGCCELTTEMAFTADGRTWQAINSSTFDGRGDTTVHDIAYLDHRYIGVGSYIPTSEQVQKVYQRAAVWMSKDGVTWRRRYRGPDSTDFDRIVFERGRFIVQGAKFTYDGDTETSHPMAWTSVDGLSWVEDPTLVIAGSKDLSQESASRPLEWQGLTRAFGRHIDLDDGMFDPPMRSTHLVFASTSHNGRQSEIDLGHGAHEPYNEDFWQLAARDDRIVAVASYTTGHLPGNRQVPRIDSWTSTDGVDWQRCSWHLPDGGVNTLHTINAVSVVDRTFVAVASYVPRGEVNGHGEIFTSEDGCIWDRVDDPTFKGAWTFMGIAKLGNEPLIVGTRGTGEMTNKGEEFRFVSWSSSRG